MVLQLDKAIGAVAIDTWTNFCLYTLELIQAYKYFRDYRHDHWLLRGSVILALLFDTAGSLSNAAGVYRVTVQHFGDESVFLTQGLEIPIYCINAGIAGLICESYLTFRFYRLSKKRWFSILLLCAAAVATAGAFVVAIFIIEFSEYSERDRILAPAIIWLALEVASDIAIACSLVFFLLKYTSDAFDRTKSILYRLILVAIESGSISSAVAFLVLICYLTDFESNVSVGFGFNLARVYTLTLLFNLNLRSSGLLASASSGAHSNAKGSFFATGDRGRARSTAHPQEAISMVPIQVLHEVQVHSEGGRDDDEADGRFDKSDDADSQNEKASAYRSAV